MEWTVSRSSLATGAAALGGTLLAAPWILGFDADGAATASAVTIGCAMLVVAAVAGPLRREWADEAALTLGAWSLIAPFLFGFADRSEALWSHLAFGAAAMALGVAAADWRSSHPPRSAA